MKNILGIGGLFFRSKNPKELKDWYINVLGVNIEEYVWQQEAGPTAFEPFSLDNDYFSKDKNWMLNFRVRDLDSLIEDLKNKGINVEQKEEWNSMPELGKFARVYDPENNAIELWEPTK